MRKSNTHPICVLDKVERDWVWGNTEETMSKTFIKSMKILITDLISPHNCNVGKFEKKRYKIHITVKMINIKVKEKILRASREEIIIRSGMETVS